MTLAAHGHLAWWLFAVFFFTGTMLLAVDFAWRCVAVRAPVLGAAAGAIWLAGIVLICWLNV